MVEQIVARERKPREKICTTTTTKTKTAAAMLTILTTLIQDTKNTHAHTNIHESHPKRTRKIDNFCFFHPSQSVSFIHLLSSILCGTRCKWAKYFVCLCHQFCSRNKNRKRVNDVIWGCVYKCVLTTKETAHDGTQKKINKAITVDWAAAAAAA